MRSNGIMVGRSSDRPASGVGYSAIRMTASGSKSAIAARPRLVRLPINSKHYTRLSRLWRRSRTEGWCDGLRHCGGRRRANCGERRADALVAATMGTLRNAAMRTPSGNMIVAPRSPASLNMRATESFAFASLIVVATLRCAVTGATRACA